MGTKASKPAQAATRKFPSRAPGAAVPPPHRPAAAPRSRAQQQPSGTGPAKAAFEKDDAIRADSIDPDPMTNPAFSRRLKQMGIATPNPTLSNSSTATPMPGSQLGPSFPSPSNNPTLNALEARKRLQEQAESELENMRDGRELVDVGTLRQALLLRQSGTPAADIEKRFRLKKGVVARLGTPGVVTPLA